jgi:peptide-methionine (S)-S-oxide reductase
MFGLGCFWGAERKFWELGDGIYVTAVGYAGGMTPKPDYEEVCSGRTGHNEVVLVVYDPKKISYDTLLKTFWESHDPTQGMRQGNDTGTQYRSGIYTFNACAEAGGGGLEGDVRAGVEEKALRRDHDRDRRRARVLFRRGLSPAVSG